jgi:hypothetical protein
MFIKINMESMITDIVKKVNNIKRLKPNTQKRLIKKYSTETNIPEKYFECILNNDVNTLINDFETMKHTPEMEQLGLDKLNLKNINENTIKDISKITSKLSITDNSSDDSDLSDDDDNPIITKVTKLKEGNLRNNINRYLVDNNLFSKTERMVVLLDPVLKSLFNLNINKMELKEFNKLL